MSAVETRAPVEDALLDALLDALVERPWSELRMADVARAAGVSRQTLYARFRSREEFAQALVIREGERFLREVERAVLARTGDPRAALAAAFDVFLTRAAENPLVRAMVHGDESGTMLPLVTTQGQPVVAYAAERLAAVILRGWPQVAAHEAGLLAECLVRLAISYAALPDGPAAMTAEHVTELLGPYLEKVLAEAEGRG